MTMWVVLRARNAQGERGEADKGRLLTNYFNAFRELLGETVSFLSVR